jgi:hypothetical protein
VVLTRARQLLVGREVPPQEGLRVVMSQEALARRPAAQVPPPLVLSGHAASLTPY